MTDNDPNPSLKAQKVYTRGGDLGETSLVSGTRVSKADPRLDAYGTVDELNCVIGVLIHQIGRELHAPSQQAAIDDLQATLTSIQRELFNLGSRLACEKEDILQRLPAVGPGRVRELESLMDRYSERLSRLQHFILPGGSASAAQAHIARTVARRAERACVALAQTATVEPILIQYLNRLNDYFFVLARHLNRILGVDEPIWIAGKPDSVE